MSGHDKNESLCISFLLIMMYHVYRINFVRTRTKHPGQLQINFGNRETMRLQVSSSGVGGTIKNWK